MVAGGVPFPMLSDAGGRIGRLYGVYDEEAGVDVRGMFIIDPDGVLQGVEILTPSVGRSVDELIRRIQAFRHARQTGEVTPADWRPGKQTLEPGEALTGNVHAVWQLE
jgi:peroxiredoxin (alkyl hydroperoxide reductase subunit C)